MDHNLQQYNDADHGAILFAALAGDKDFDIEALPGAQRFIGFGDTESGYGPACIVDLAGTEYVAEPHVTWFPWTTPANRIVNFKWAMAHLAETKEVMLIVEKSQNKFFEHFVKRRVLRKIGVIKHLPLVDEVHMYQYEKERK